MKTLKPYQREGITFLRQRSRALLGDDPGTGKTRQLIEAADEPALIVAPAYAEEVWRDEIALWRPNLEHEFVSYSSLCQREGRKVLPVVKPHLKGWWGTLIFDESHYLKGRKTNWTQAAMDLKGERVWLASGTPIPNWAYELWINLRILKPNDTFLRSYWRWVEHWFHVWKAPWGSMEIGALKGCKRRCKTMKRRCAHWEAFFDENLGGLYLARSIDDVLPDLPPLTQQVIKAPMTPKQRAAYRSLKRDYRAAVDGHEIVAWSDGGLAAKLRKVTSGLGVEIDGSDWESGKINVLRDLLHDRKPPLVIFTWYRATARAVERAVKEAGLTCAVRTGDYTRKQQDLAVRRFKAGEVDVLIGGLAVTSESITLTNASTCIFVERSWRPSMNDQAMRRLRRLSQRNPVRVLQLVTEGTVDQRMLKILRAKSDQQMRALRPVAFSDLL